MYTVLFYRKHMLNNQVNMAYINLKLNLNNNYKLDIYQDIYYLKKTYFNNRKYTNFLKIHYKLGMKYHIFYKSYLLYSIFKQDKILHK